MRAIVICGGQYGGEGKGKVANYLAHQYGIKYAVKTGGTNSAHQVVHRGKSYVLRQFPAASLKENMTVIFPAGSLIDMALFKRELKVLGLPANRIIVDPRASVILKTHKDSEKRINLRESIGSTLSGTGGSQIERILRITEDSRIKAFDNPEYIYFFSRFILTDTTEFLNNLDDHNLVLVEGGQGYGLCNNNGEWPYVTSRNTTAAGIIADAGISPNDVDTIVMVIRAFPIRAGGNSGPLPRESHWCELENKYGWPELNIEIGHVTGINRRIAEWDKEIVIKALRVNKPNTLILNHLDYIDSKGIVNEHNELSVKAIDFIEKVKDELQQDIDYVGFGPGNFIKIHGGHPF